MSFKFGFYNSLNGDRKYDAIQFGQLFDGIINDGVFMSIGGKLMVTASEGMSIAVATGRAWFDSTWSFNDSIMVLDLDDAEVILNRIDAVVLEVNADDASRTNSIKIIKGTPATEPLAPELTDTGKLHQHPLAYVYVAANATEITQSNITNKVGTSDCPFVTGILETMDIDDLIAQWGTEWDEFMNATETEAANFMSTEQAEFLAWFNDMKDQLSEDAAGNLEMEIDVVSDLIAILASGMFVYGQAVDMDLLSNVTEVGVRPFVSIPVDDTIAIAGLTSLVENSNGIIESLHFTGANEMQIVSAIYDVSTQGWSLTSTSVTKSQDFNSNITTEWTAYSIDGIYYQDVACDGITADDNPIIDLSPTLDNFDAELEAWSKIFRIDTYNGYLKVFASEPIETNLSIHGTLTRGGVKSTWNI